MSIIFNPFTSNFDYVGSGSTYWLNPVATFASLPSGDPAGAARVVLNEDAVYVYNLGTTTWIFAGKIKTAVVGSSPNVNGYSVGSDNTLTLQPSNATNPGVLTTGSQTIAGTKTFTGNIVASVGVDAPASTLNLGTSASIVNIGQSGSTVNINGTTLYENVTNLQVADKLITVNKGGAVASGTGSGVEVEENASITGYVKTSVDRNSWTLLAPNTAGIATVTPGAGGITLDQSSHNPVTLGTANGLSLSTQALSLQAADTTHTGALTSTDWNTFNNKQSAGNYITQLTGDVTAGPGPGSVASTLATVNATTGSFGSSTAIPSFTVNGKGLVTAASTNVVIAPAGTLTGTTLAANVVTSSLTSIGTLGSLNVTGSINDSSLTVSQAVFTDASKNLVSNAITGSGNVVMSTSPTLSGTSIIPTIAGGSAAGANLVLESTTGVGTTDSIIFRTGSQSTRITIDTSGNVNINGLTASLPVQTDASKNLISSAIDLSGTQATGTLASGRFPALTGDVTTTAGSLSTTIANSAVTNTKLANMASSTVKANVTGGSAAPTDVPFVSTATSNSGVFRDGSGNFAATTITANLTGTATNATTAVNFSGSLSGEVSGGQSTTVLSTAAVIGKGLTGYVANAGIVSSADSILTAIEKIDANTNLKAPLASPTFTGVVTMPTPFTLGATSVTSTGTQLNYLNAATGTIGTTSSNVVFSASPTFSGTTSFPNSSSIDGSGNAVFGGTVTATSLNAIVDGGTF